MKFSTRLSLLTGAAACALVLSVQAVAQAFPTKPVRVVVAFSAGGVADIRARQFAQKMSDALGQAVIVENKPGASGAIGAEYVAKSPADGYTLLFGSINELALVPAMGVQIGYNPQKDFAAISLASITAIRPSVSTTNAPASAPAPGAACSRCRCTAHPQGPSSVN